MANKFTGVTKAAIAGAVFGSAVGLVAVPSTKKKRNSRLNSITRGAGCILRTVGSAMQNIADIISG